LWFEKDYLAIVDELKEHKELSFSFLNAVLQKNESEILTEYNNSILLNNLTQSISQKYKVLILRFVEVLCDRKAKNSSN
jgi:hypothetical protein